MAVMIVLLLTSFFLGDWRNWRKYHTTLLYWIICTLSYDFLTYTYPLWVFQSDRFVNHTIASFIVMFVYYPAALYLYLPYFPKKTLPKQITYLLFWVVFATGMEWFYRDKISYNNGWELHWSFVFNIMMFSMLKLHYHRPLLTYLLSLIIAVILLILFKVPVLELK